MAISDVLFETVENLDHYLNDPFYDDWYEGELRARIVRLRDEAKALVVELFTPPTDEEVAEAERRKAAKDGGPAEAAP